MRNKEKLITQLRQESSHWFTNLSFNKSIPYDFKMKKLLPILFILIITSCSKEIPSDQLVERGGITYQVNSQTSFTGTSIEYHIDTIIDNKFEETLPKNKIKFKNGVKDGLSESFYFNGQLSLIENYKNNQLDGLRESFYKNGQLKESGVFKKGTKDGIHSMFFEDSKLMKKSSWNHGTRDGPFESYYPNDQHRINGTYKRGRPFEVYHENSLLKEKGNYKDGRPLDGLFEFYNPDNLLLRKGTFKDGNIINITLFDYYDDGRIRKVSNYKGGYVDEYGDLIDGIKNGPREYYSILQGIYYLYSDGQYKDGKEEGVWNRYHNTGHISMVTNYKDGLKDGPYELYYGDGRFHSRVFYKEGKEQ